MPDRREERGLHRLAVALAIATLGLIAAGGLVTSTESGLSVPDWPTTYGQNPFTFPPSKWVGGIRFEHTHRLIASAVGLMTLILAVWLARREPRAWVRRLGWCALGAVVAQGILGGLTVKFLLPTPISVAHACLAQTFLCLAVTLAVVTSSRWQSLRPDAASPLSRAAAAAVVLVFLQLVVGAVMRHTKAGLAIPDFPLAFGALIPAIPSFAVGIHFAHRVMALAVAAAVGVLAVRAARSGRRDLRGAAVALPGLVLFQIALGGLTVLSGKDFRVATAHVVTGALLLGTTLLVALLSRRTAASNAAGRVVPMPLAPRGAFAAHSAGRAR